MTINHQPSWESALGADSAEELESSSNVSADPLCRPPRGQD